MGHYCSGDPRCSVILPKGVKCCAEHTKPAWSSRQPVKRVTGEKLQRLRQALWDQQQGRCKGCDRPILLTEMLRDHIIPLSEGTVDQPTNEGCQGLCVPCHDAKTQAESLRGRKRNG